MPILLCSVKQQLHLHQIKFMANNLAAVQCLT